MTETPGDAPGRRDFIKAAAVMIGGFIGSLIALPSLVYLLSPALGTETEDAWIELGPLERYAVGMPTLAEFTRTRVNGWERAGVTYGVFVVRENAQKVRAFSNICTHLGCRVRWHADIQHYVSPCHDGHFDRLGEVVSGPPPRPLDEFVTRIEGDKLLIQLPPFKRSAGSEPN